MDLLDPYAYFEFTDYRADEVYLADINGDGVTEFLFLQSPGIYCSEIFNGTRWAAPEADRGISCLTAVSQNGEVLWRHGNSMLERSDWENHCADQMVCMFQSEEDGGSRVAFLAGGVLKILDAKTGACLRERELPLDNFAIIIPVRGRSGLRLFCKVTDAAAEGFWYGDPGLLLDEKLQTVAELNRVVGSGHSPRAFDLDGDGFEELTVGYEAFDSDGKRLWRLEGQTPENYTDPSGTHVDQTICVPGPDGELTLVYAGSRDALRATCRGELQWRIPFGHPQHVVAGDFRAGDRQAALALFNIETGPALADWGSRAGIELPTGKRNGILWLDWDGGIVNALYPPSLWPEGVARKGGVHSGEGIMLLPGAGSGVGDALVVRDCGWPTVWTLDGTQPFRLDADRYGIHSDTSVGPDGYGVKVADLDGDGNAEILVHDRRQAWIYHCFSDLRFINCAGV